MHRIHQVAIGFGAALAVSVSLAAQAPQQHGAEHAAQSAQPHQMGAMTDAGFVHMMLKHHQDGIEMARIAEQKGASAAVKALATKIRSGQERDLPELKKHQTHVGQAPKSAEHQAHDQAMQKEAQGSMKRLQDATGTAVDHAFVEEMSKHHQMAIDMVEKTKFQNADLRKFAQNMAANQRKELAELKNAHAAHK